MNEIDEFEQIVDYIYGVYLDATTGFKQLLIWFEKNQGKALEMLKDSHPELANIDYLDSVEMIYGNGNPNDPSSIVLHRCTQKEYKERNTEKGVNYKFIGNVVLVSLYQYWEDHYRSNVAKSLGLKQNELKAPIMGDLRILRTSIVHHAGVALKDIKKCELLKWYKEGDEIFIDTEKFDQIIFHVKSMIKGLRAKALKTQQKIPNGLLP
jgi:hypothetical protein